MNLLKNVSEKIVFLMGVAFLIFFTSGIFFVALYPFNPARFDELKVLQEFASPGDALFLEMRFEKYTDITPDVTRYLTSCDGSQGTITVERTVGDAKVGDKKKIIVIEVPKHTPIGQWKNRFLIDYPYLGGLRHIERWIESGCFEVGK